MPAIAQGVRKRARRFTGIWGIFAPFMNLDEDLSSGIQKPAYLITRTPPWKDFIARAAGFIWRLPVYLALGITR